MGSTYIEPEKWSLLWQPPPRPEKRRRRDPSRPLLRLARVPQKRGFRQQFASGLRAVRRPFRRRFPGGSDGGSTTVCQRRTPLDQARSGAPGPGLRRPGDPGVQPPGPQAPNPHGPGCKRRRDVGPVVHLVSAPACGGNAKTPSNPVRRATNAVPGVTPPSLLAAAPWSAPPASPDSS